MTEAEIFAVARATTGGLAGLYGQVISINFAMIVAIFYFLNRSSLTIKLLALVVYLIGMLMFICMMLMESNTKGIALRALAAIPATQASQLTTEFLALNHTWLFYTTAFFLNGALWALIGTVVFLLFVWKKPAD